MARHVHNQVLATNKYTIQTINIIALTCDGDYNGQLELGFYPWLLCSKLVQNPCFVFTS